MMSSITKREHLSHTSKYGHLVDVRPASSTTSSPATCISVPSGATDTPTRDSLRVPGIRVRLACGITDETVSDCPFLCGAKNTPGSPRPTERACVSNGASHNGCEECLPPCKASHSKSTTSTKERKSIALRYFAIDELADPPV